MKLTKIEKLLLELIKIPSVSGGEAEIVKLITSKLEGFKVSKQKVDEDSFNLVAKKGKSKIWLVAHMDTVPGDLPVKVTKDKIHGRGACDNKQSIAASILVGNKLRDINILFTSKEELGGIGAKRAAEKLKNAEAVIVQEPTAFQIITGQRGVVTFIIETSGKAGHSSEAVNLNAIHKLVDAIHELETKEWTAFNVGLISGGSAENVSAAKAQATIVVRPSSASEYEDIRKTIQGLEAKTSIKLSIPPFQSPLPFPRKTAEHFSEMVFFPNSIQFGVGKISLAHSDNEHILRKDLNVLPDKLENLIKLVSNTTR